MKRIYWLFPLAFTLVGCLASNGLEYQAMSETNQYHLARVRKGMGEKQVLQIMHKPYSYETFQIDDDIYDVWFYVTRPTGLDQTRMVPQNLTPLTFKNGVLVGIGYNWYYYAMKERVAETSTQTPEIEKPKSQSIEDEEFEKALKTYPQKSAPSQQQPSPEKKTPDNEKLPPNVHIISQNEKSCGSCGKAPQEKSAAPSQSAPCLYPDSGYRPDRFSILSKSQLPSPPITEEPAPSLSTNKTLLKPYEPKGPLSVTSHKEFSKIRKGMTEAQVMKIIGSTAAQDIFKIGEDVYHVWFYEISSKNKKTKKISLTFKNGILIGMTDDEYNQLKDKRDPDQIDCYDQKGERLQEDESEQNFNYW